MAHQCVPRIIIVNIAEASFVCKRCSGVLIHKSASSLRMLVVSYIIDGCFIFLTKLEAAINGHYLQLNVTTAFAFWTPSAMLQNPHQCLIKEN